MDKFTARLNTLYAILLTIFALSLPASSVADEVELPEVMLKRISDDVIKILKDERELIKKEPDRIYEIVNDYILPHLDDVSMAKLALGKNWRKAEKEEKIEFVHAFRDLLVRTYSQSLKEFRDQEIKFFPTRLKEGAKKVVVKSEVLQSGGPSIPVSYRMRIKNSDWKVYDIIIDGVSLVTSYRGTFSQEVRKGGMSGLLKMLRDKSGNIPRDKATT